MTLLDNLVEHRWLLLAALVVLYAVRKVVQYRRIRRFPGPWTTAFSGIPHNIKAYTGEAHNWYRDISDTYGRLCEPPSNNDLASD